jgi:AmiR/NasT family two-component response regulator
MATAHEVFADTGRVVEREMSDEELAEIHEEQAAKTKARLTDEKATAKAKAALYEKLGITADEAALLLK